MIRRFVRHGALVTAGIVCGYGMTYAYYVTTARALGVAGVGLLNALVAAMLLAALPGAFIAAVVTKTSSERSTARDFGALRALADASSLALLPITAIVGIGTFVTSPALFGFFHLHDPVTLALAAAGFAIIAALPLQRAVLQGASAFVRFTLSNVIEGVVRGLIGFVLLFAGGGLRLAVAGFAGASLVAYLANLVFLRRISPVARGGFPRIAVGDAALIALPVAAVTLMSLIDVVMVRHVASATEAGLYVSVAFVGRALITITAALPAVLYPHTVARVVEGRSPRPMLLVSLTAVAAAIAVTLAVCGFAPDFVIGFFGRGFYAAQPYLVPYVLAASFLAAANIITFYLLGIGKRRFGSVLAIVALAEPVTMGLAVHTATQAIAILLVGHATALVVVLVALVIGDHEPRAITLGHDPRPGAA